MHEIVIFGAGNIGRSFIGSIFSRGGWQVTFVDADKKLVDSLNHTGGYTIKIKQNGCEEQIVKVTGISALHSDEKDAVMEKLTSCRICSTSVGKSSLDYVVPVIAEAVKRRSDAGLPPLDVIIAENIRDGASYFHGFFDSCGMKDFEVGLVETSIGKMVPIMTAEDLEADPLALHAEAYNTLIVDKKGFLNGVPELPEIKAVDNIRAWVERKLFIHNLGHAASAYFGYEAYPERRLIAEVLQDSDIYARVRSVMEEAAAALSVEYPEDFTPAQLSRHIDDLLKRFLNSSLGDTVYRVGRDLGRKLNRSDRVLGAIALCIRHGLQYANILDVFCSALSFRAEAPEGLMYKADVDFITALREHGAEWIIKNSLDIGLDEEQLSGILTEACGRRS